MAPLPRVLVWLVCKVVKGARETWHFMPGWQVFVCSLLLAWVNWKLFLPCDISGRNAGTYAN